MIRSYASLGELSKHRTVGITFNKLMLKLSIYADASNKSQSKASSIEVGPTLIFASV